MQSNPSSCISVMQTYKIQHSICRASQNHLRTITPSYNHSRAISCLHLRFWFSVWRKLRDLNSAFTTSGTLKVRIGKYKQFTGFRWSCSNATVCSFVEFTMPNFALHMFVLQWCKWIVVFGWDACDATSLAHRDLSICIRVRLFTNILSDMGRERRWLHWIKKVLHIRIERLYFLCDANPNHVCTSNVV